MDSVSVMAKPDAPQVIVMIGTAGALLAAGVGGTTLAIQHGGVASDAPRDWFIIAGWLFGLTVLYAVLYFLVHPAVAALANRRSGRLAAIDPQAIPPAGALAILGAGYGVPRKPNSEVDVVQTVRGWIVNGALDHSVENNEFGIPDPAPNEYKSLVVLYSLDGTEMPKAIFDEGGRAVLP